MSSPWGKVTSEQVAPCSLQDVMSEQLAADLQEKDDKKEWEFISGAAVDAEIDLAALTAGMSSEDTKNDQMLAQILQMEYDKEYDKEVKAKEKKYNGESKVSLSFENYTTLHPAYRDEEDEIVPTLDDDYEVEMKFDKKAPTFNNQGVSGKGKNMITKHDSSVCGRRNASRMMEFPPEFEVGDGEGLLDMKLPNHVYNKLKLHYMAENKRNQKLHEKKEHSTAEQAMDLHTRGRLYKLVKSLVINGSISTEKESVFHAFGGEISKDDYMKQNPRKIIELLALLKTTNLNRMEKFGLACPFVEVEKKHILFMSFVGEDQKPAPKLKDAVMSDADLKDAYIQTLEFIKTLHHKCNLVHADLSEYNMLWWKDKVWVIDVSQAVDNTHPLAMEFLHRDCTNVSNFFRSKGVHEVMSPEELFNHVTGLRISGEGEDFIAQLRRYDTEKSKEHILCAKDHKNFAFDFFFDKSQQQRKEALKDQVQISDSEEEDIEKDET